MAKNVSLTKFEVQTVENDDGTLKALTIQKTLRVSRLADSGAVLDYGSTSNVGDPIEVPAERVADLIRELADWPMYYATGTAARDAG